MSGPADDPTADGYLLLSEEFLADLAQDAVEYARSLGASEAMAIASDSGGMTMRISNGRIETARRDGTQSLGITVYDAQRTGRASTQALDRAAVHRAVDQAVAIARQVQPDDLAGLADPAWIARDVEMVPLFAPSGLSADQLADAALQIERGALEAAGSDRVRVVDAAASSHDSRWARAISHGFCEAASSSINHRWCVAIGERDEAMVRDYWSSSDRRTAFLDDPAAVGREAAGRALAKLGGAGLGTQRAPILLDARMAASLVGDFTGTLNGMAQYQGQTYFLDPVGKDLLAAHLSLTENPFEPYGLASTAYDSDGIAGSRRAIVDRGVVQGLFVSALAARKLKTAPTGNADGPGNLTLTSSLTEPGDDLAAMFRRMGRGVWITEFLGGGVNPVNGAYSKAASGFWIEGGEISHPVHDFTVAGDLPTMLRGIVGVGANVHREGGIRTGAILIDEMQIAGR